MFIVREINRLYCENDICIYLQHRAFIEFQLKNYPCIQPHRIYSFQNNYVPRRSCMKQTVERYEQ